MKCACGRDARPLFPILFAAPIVLGALAAAILLLTRRGGADGAAFIAVTIPFGAFVTALILFAVRVLRGRACGQCGRSS
jgi:hypothetical protein